MIHALLKPLCRTLLVYPNPARQSSASSRDSTDEVVEVRRQPQSHRRAGWAKVTSLLRSADQRTLGVFDAAKKLIID